MNELKKQMDIIPERVKKYAQELIKNYSYETQPLAFWILDIEGIENAVKRWKKAMPSVRPCFAVKCNPEPHLLKHLADLGCGFDCASINEIKEILQLGFTPEYITYSQTFKPVNQLMESWNLGIHHTLVDCVEEIEKVAKYTPNMGVMLRIMENDTSAGHVFGEKFGCHDDEIDYLLQVIKKNNLDLNGVHFHVGSDSHNSEIFVKAIKKARDVVTMAEKYGFKPYLFDIGGGFSQFAPFEQFAETIEKTIKEMKFPENSVFIAEPGRYLASNAFHLVTSIHGKRSRIKDNKRTIEYCHGDGLHGCFGCCMWFEKERRCQPVRDVKEDEEQFESIVYGPTCNGSDKVSVQLLPDLEPGKDWLIFPNMGAYSLSLAVNFNGFESRNHEIYQLPSETTKEIVIDEFLEKNSVPSLNAFIPKK